MNLMKGIAGTGSLAIPYAFSKVSSFALYSPLGWYHSVYPSFRHSLCYDGDCYVSAVRYSQ